MELHQAVSLRDQWKIFTLYRSAFPKSERKPFWVIRAMQKQGKSDIWYFEENGSFRGLATTVKDGNRVLLDYFAVTGRDRGQGNGGKMLELILKTYEGQELFGEIEVEDPQAENNADRIRRKAFYLRHGLRALGTRVSLFGVEMELLTNGFTLSYQEYLAFYCKNIGEFARDNIHLVTD